MFTYAVSNWIYGDQDLEKTYKRLQRFGFNAVELVGEPERYQPKRIKEFQQIYGIKVCSILSWCLWPMEDRDLAHVNDEMRRRAIAYIRRNVDLAAAIGAPIVVVIPAPSGRSAPHQAPTRAADWQKAAGEEWVRAVDSVRQVTHYAQSSGITIAVEPINRFETFLVNNADQGLKFIEHVDMPNVKLHLDTFHMNIEDAAMGAAVQKAGSKLVSMHLSDSNRCAIGRGHTDFKEVIGSLLNIGFNGPLILEPLPLHPNPFVAGKLPEYQAAWDLEIEESINKLRDIERRTVKEMPCKEDTNV